MTMNATELKRLADQHKAYAASKPANATPSISHGNFSTTEPLVAPKMDANRAGSDDFLAVKSHGVGSPQLVINSPSASVRQPA